MEIVGPVRTCVGCRGRFAQATLVRFVRAVDGWRGDGVLRRGAGRGAYLCSRACAIKVEKNKRYGGLSAVAREHGALCAEHGNVYDIGVPLRRRGPGAGANT